MVGEVRVTSTILADVLTVVSFMCVNQVIANCTSERDEKERMLFIETILSFNPVQVDEFLHGNLSIVLLMSRTINSHYRFYLLQIFNYDYDT